MTTKGDGWSPTTPATDQIQGFIDTVRRQVQEQFDVKFKLYTAYEFIEKRDRGMHYIVSIDIGEGHMSYVRETLFKQVSGDVQLKYVSSNHDKNEPLNP